MIRILIQRTLLKDRESDYHQVIRQIKQKASHVLGYLSGEILVDPENSLKCLVMSNWDSIESWQKWADSKERKAGQAMIREMLEKEEKISIYKLDVFKS